MKILSMTVRALGCAALILTAITAFSAEAQADTGANHWTAQQIATAPDGTSRVLWTAESHTGLGEVAGIWVLNTAGSVTHVGTTYGPYTDSNGSWTAKQLAVASDGTSRLLWENFGVSGEEAAVWTLDATGNVTSTGTTYMPTAETSGTWYPQQIAVASDGTSRLLWAYFGTAGVKTSVWTLDATGTKTAAGTTYGPYSTSAGSWFPENLAVAPDGTSRLLWVVNGTKSASTGITSGDTIGFWTLDATGTETHVGTAYGPFSGWAVSGFGIDPTDSTLRVLWYNTSSTSSGDTAGLWSFDSNGTETLIGPAYGSYAGWSAVSVAALSDGTSRVIWEQNTAKYRSSGTVVGEWAFDGNDREAAIGSVYGPFSTWSVQDASLDESDGTLRLLWDRSDDTSGLWSLNSSGVETSIGTAYGPYTY